MSIKQDAKEHSRLKAMLEQEPLKFQLHAYVQKIARALDARCVEKLSGEWPERLVEDIFRGSAPERSSR